MTHKSSKGRRVKKNKQTNNKSNDGLCSKNMASWSSRVKTEDSKEQRLLKGQRSRSYKWLQNTIKKSLNVNLCNERHTTFMYHKKLNEPRMLEIYLNEATRSKNTKPQHQRYEAALCKER